MDTDLESFRDIPGYKAILKAVLKSQIQHLVEQLSSETDEESIILTASISDGTLSHLGSVSGKSFINGNEEIKSQFLGFCLKEHHAKEQRRESPRADQSKATGNSSLSSAVMMSEQYGRNVKPTQKALMSRSGKRKGPYSRVRPDRIVGSPSDTGGGDKSGTIKIEPIDTEFDRVNVDSNREIQSTGAGSEFYEDNLGTVATHDGEDNSHETNVRTDQDFNTQSASPEPGTSGYKVEFSDPDTDFNISGFDLGDSVGSPEKWKQESANLNITDEARTSADVDHSKLKEEPKEDTPQPSSPEMIYSHSEFDGPTKEESKEYTPELSKPDAIISDTDFDATTVEELDKSTTKMSKSDLGNSFNLYSNGPTVKLCRRERKTPHKFNDAYNLMDIHVDTDEDLDYDSDRDDPDWQTDQACSESDIEHDNYIKDSEEDADESETWLAQAQLPTKLTQQDDVTSATGFDNNKGYELIRDINIPEIFFRKIVKNDTFNNKRKKSDRIQNSRHACKFCGKCVCHIQDHLRRSHSNKQEVKAIEECKDERLKEQLKDMLRFEGDHLHNKQVVDIQVGELFLFRRPDQEFDHIQYGPCSVCKAWLLKNSLYKHMKTCNGDMKNIKRKKRYLSTMSDVAKGSIPQHAEQNQMLVNEVFTIMAQDEVGLVARQDELICQLGEYWLKSCNDDKKKRCYLASQHMRLMARLLICIRDTENNNGLTMWDILRPSFFESLVKAALNISLPDMDDIEELKIPTNVMKLNHDLIRMGGFKSSKSCDMYDKTGDDEWKTSRKAAAGLLVEINSGWKVKCSKVAREVLLEWKLRKKEKLPNPEDIRKLGEFLITELQAANLDSEDLTYTRYKASIELTQARLLTYNKRRTGEVENILVKDYMHKLDIADIDKGLMGDISETERYLLNTHDLIQTRGKQGGIVPVLIPQECKPVLDFLADTDVRQKLNITSSYLFASNTSGYPVQAYDSLQKVCQQCRLSRPQEMTSTNMRKYMATLTQVMNISDSEMQQMCRHLGHTVPVHLTHDKTKSPYIERVTLGKILLMQDMNIQSKFQSTPLDEVDFNDIIKEKETESDSEQPSIVNDQAATCTSPQNNGINHTDENDVMDMDDPEHGTNVKTMRGKNHAKRQKWSSKEMEEINRYFAKQLQEKVAPRRDDCLKAKQASFKAGGELHNRPWHLIVKKVSNINHKKDQKK